MTRSFKTMSKKQKFVLSFSNIFILTIFIPGIKSEMFTNPIRLLDLFKADHNISKAIQASMVRQETGPIRR